MKLSVNLGKDITIEKITLPKRVPLLMNFDARTQIGHATIEKDMTATLELKDQEAWNKIQEMLEVGLSGKANIKGNKITEFSISSASIQLKLQKNDFRKYNYKRDIRICDPAKTICCIKD